MNKKEAIKIVEILVEKYVGTRAEHVKLQELLQFLHEKIVENTEE